MLDVLMEVLEMSEVIRCAVLCMLDVVEGKLCSLEVLVVPEVIRCTLLCMLETMEGRLCSLEALEVLEGRLFSLGLLVVLAAGVVSNLLIIATTAAKGGSETPFEGLRLYVILMGGLGALVLNHRLVVNEYQARTQLFLEALPVARWRMVAVKYGLGLGTMLVLLGVSFAIACLLAWRHEGMTPRFTAILAARSVSAVWFAQSFCFLMGLTGRYRLALYLTMLLGCAFVAEHKALEFTRFGPVALLDSRFAYEREDIPWQALGVTWEMILVFTLLAAGLSLVREGSVAALLAEKMSHREKVLI